LEWWLTDHLLAYFAPRRLDEITVEGIDAYRLATVKQGKLNTTSINLTLLDLRPPNGPAATASPNARMPTFVRRRLADRSSSLLPCLAGAPPRSAACLRTSATTRASVRAALDKALNLGHGA
jgi:hypothetical protein